MITSASVSQLQTDLAALVAVTPLPDPTVGIVYEQTLALHTILTEWAERLTSICTAAHLTLTPAAIFAQFWLEIQNACIEGGLQLARIQQRNPRTQIRELALAHAKLTALYAIESSMIQIAGEDIYAAIQS